MRHERIKSALERTIARVRPPMVVPPVLLTVPPLYVGEAPAAPAGGLLLRMLTEGLFVGSTR